MEVWQDEGIILSARPHGENGAIVRAITENHGVKAGYVYGAKSTKMRGVLEAGNRVTINWQAKSHENLGQFTLELITNPSVNLMQEAVKLAALQSACALCDQALPEGEKHEGIFFGLMTLLDMLDTDIWAPSYVLWEIAMLRELGFSLDLETCAGGGDNANLAYVSPKTGRAVSAQEAEPYKDKLLPLADFLKPQGYNAEPEEVQKALTMTGYFLEHWVFNHHTQGIPQSRLRFAQRFGKTI